MFERFTDRARRVVVLAQEEARLLSHHYIGTEHILLGLLHEGEGLAYRALDEVGIGLEVARAEVETVVGRGKSEPSGHIPFTPRAKKTLELSLREALQLGHNYIGTEHILLGLIREGQGPAIEVLDRIGGGADRARQEVLRLVHSEPAPESGSGEEIGAPRPVTFERASTSEILARLVDLSTRLEAIDERLARIEDRLDPGASTG
ncbi:MAG: clpC [Actinomycetia bacterium]|nr:clpC [Actinomycetes bacterium]